MSNPPAAYQVQDLGLNLSVLPFHYLEQQQEEAPTPKAVVSTERGKCLRGAWNRRSPGTRKTLRKYWLLLPWRCVRPRRATSAAPVPACDPGAALLSVLPRCHPLLTRHEALENVLHVVADQHQAGGGTQKTSGSPCFDVREMVHSESVPRDQSTEVWMWEFRGGCITLFAEETP